VYIKTTPPFPPHQKGIHTPQQRRQKNNTMSQRNDEGDAILFYTFTQFKIALPPSIDQMTADTLMSVVVASLALISHGRIQLPSKLPPNMASRHRMCTEVAAKVKEVGFPGECGYNQLLYPSEAPTRALLTWLVQHLPRPEDDRVEEAAGAGALLSRRIAQRLAEWKGQPWLHPSCSTGKPARLRSAVAPAAAGGTCSRSVPTGASRWSRPSSSATRWR
jgi:Protein of unknown function (DUF812)